ncbi:MAG: hypothetical protein DRO67_10595, partial [Candidatus Asgardarchaeum californiense]
FLSSIFVSTLIINKTKTSDEETQEGKGENLAPNVKIKSDVTSGKTPLVVSFEASIYDDNEIDSYEWDFGDGDKSSSKEPTHTFDTEGTYFVTLIVIDNKGKISQDSLIIEAKKNQPPIARASYEIPTIYYLSGPPTLVEFKGEGTDVDGEIVSYHWEFGPKYYPIVPYKGYPFHTRDHWYDYFLSSYESDEQSPLRVLTKPGYYWAELTVTDDNGATNTDKIYITIWKFNSLVKQGIKELLTA